ncbi:MAG: DinB family protein [Anaerolineales bacterium]|nr:DinB family protein [Anaerolineales bacterium]MCB8950659.1 DinB family protein [Ardenticatenales bacterium]
MLVAHFQRLFAYNEWAWRQVFPSLAQLPDAEYKAARPFFWGSLHGLMVHAVAAEAIWLTRLHGDSPTAMPQPEAFADFAAVRAQWEAGNAAWQVYLAGLTEGDATRIVSYQNTRGDAFQLPVADIVQHVANHATEHRSQMTPILFNSGVPTPPLDYMLFCRHSPQP